MNLYYNTFYSIYRVWVKMDGSDHAFKAMAALSIIIIWNLTTLAAYIDIYQYTNYETLKIPAILAMVAILVINYFIFIHNKKYIEIEASFKDLPLSKKKRGSLGVLIYAILSLVVMLWSL